MSERIFSFQRTIFEVDERLCFVIMPFKAPLDEVYLDVIKPAIETHPVSLRCIRADEIYTTGTVLGGIWEEIQKARLIISDLTNRNPNVFYELGLAHTIQKPVILLAQNIDDIPFDLRYLRYILYEFTPRGAEKLRSQLVATVQNVLSQPLSVNLNDDVTFEMKTRIRELEETVNSLDRERTELTKQIQASSVAATLMRQYANVEVIDNSTLQNSGVFLSANLPKTFIGTDGSEYLLVKSGTFPMGGKAGLHSNEDPRHTVEVGAFYISKHPVTNAQYYRFIKSKDFPPPAYWTQGKFPNKKAGHPVVGITWYDAQSYAAWVGGRLPTEAEWEKAASWDDNKQRKYRFPWGDDFIKSRLNFTDSGLRDTTPAGLYPQGASPCGALDMAGNTWEWTSTLMMDYPYVYNDGREDLNTKGFRAVRGGSWLAPLENIHMTYRNGEMPKFFSVDLGFRIVIDIPK